MITITEIRVTPRSDPRLKAFASVTLNGVFVVRGLKVIAGHEGNLFVAMPSRKRPDGTFQDVAHPITTEFRNILEEAVLAEYTLLLQTGGRDVEGEASSPSEP